MNHDFKPSADPRGNTSGHDRSLEGFTLIELLVCILIVAVLSGLAFSVSGKVQKAGDQAREINAGRQLIVAYNNAAIERNGSFLPGYDRTTSEVELQNGQIVSGPVANRYPFRLLQYLNHELDGTILVNRNKSQLNADDHYSISTHPAFGINYQFIGGNISSAGILDMPDEVVTRPASGSNLLVFASAGTASSVGNEPIEGFNILTPPRVYGPLWHTADWTESARPDHYGHVHARHNGKAISVFQDGSIRLLTIDELRDMRLWSLRAAELNDANYTVAPATGGGPRR